MATEIAKGIKKQTIIGLQAGIGVPKVGSGLSILRRSNSVFSLDTATTSNDEIVSHLQDTGVTYGEKSTSGTITGVLSPTTYQLPIEGIIRKLFAAGASSTGVSLTTAGSAGAWTLTDAASTFLTDGLKAGDVVRVTAGSVDSGTLDNNLLIISATETVLTAATLNNSAIVAEGPVASVTIAVAGKKVIAPKTSHTDSYFTFEEWYSDLAKSELFPDCKINTLGISVPATGNIPITIGVVGTGQRTIAGSQSSTSPTVETTTPPVQGTRGFVYVNETIVGCITSADVNIDSTIAASGATVGDAVSCDLTQGRLKVSGTMNAQFTSTALQVLYDAGTPVSAVIVLAADTTKDSEFMTVSMGRIKITGDAPDDGEVAVSRTYPFTAELNSTGGAALEWDESIIAIQDSEL